MSETIKQTRGLLAAELANLRAKGATDEQTEKLRWQLIQIEDLLLKAEPPSTLILPDGTSVADLDAQEA